jgi:hypothetical protein
MRIPVIMIAVLALMVSSKSVFASCYTNTAGRMECNNGEQAGGANPNTGNAWHSEKNQYGVNTTHTSAGGEAKTKNGRGVYKRPNGKDCYKTAYSHRCN